MNVVVEWIAGLVVLVATALRVVWGSWLVWSTYRPGLVLAVIGGVVVVGVVVVLVPRSRS